MGGCGGPTADLDDSLLVIEVPADASGRLLAPLLALLDRPTSLDVFETLVRHLGRPGPGALLQANLASDRLHSLDAEFGLLDSTQIADRVQSKARNRSALASRWARDQQALAVTVRGRLGGDGRQCLTRTCRTIRRRSPRTS